MDLLDFYMEKDYLFLPFDHKNFFLTHGHIYNEYHVPDALEYDVYIQGHTHIPVMREESNKIILNPGSITLPKGMSSKSYLIYQEGEFQLKDLEKNTPIGCIFL